MNKTIPAFMPSASHVSVMDIRKPFKSEIDALTYALSKRTTYISGDPNLVKNFQERYPKLGIKEVKIPESFLNCLLHITKSTKAKDHFFSFSKNIVTIADSGKDDMDIILRRGSKFNFKRLAEQYIEYNDALIKRGFYPNPAKYESSNMIDATGFFDALLYDRSATEEIQDTIVSYISENPFYAYLPCFNDGILKMSNITYCHWAIQSVDVENHTISIIMYLYQKEPSGYTPFSIFGLVIEFPKEREKLPGFKIISLQYPNLYHMLHTISPKQMKWNTTDRKGWGVITTFGKMVDAISSEGDCIIDVIQDNAYPIMSCFAYINAVIHANKKHYKPRQKKSEEIKVEKSFNPEKQKEKKLHILNNFISITSDDTPKEMTKQTAVKYHLASWTVKGHIRHYKSGKVTYVKPHTKKRKCMEKEAETTTPRTQKVILDNPK